MNTKSPGQVTIVPVRKGRKRNFGSLAFINGHAMICIGYDESGLNAAYIERDRLKDLKGAYVRSGLHLLVRVLNWIGKRYGIEIRIA